MTTTTPSAIIYSYTQEKGYIYLHVPARLVRECGITSGNRFLAFVRNDKLVIEQEKLEQVNAEKPLLLDR